MEQSQRDKIWIVTFPTFASSNNRTRLYYKEETFLKAISKYKREVTVKVYELNEDMIQVGKGDEIHETYLKIKNREERLNKLLDEEQ